MNRRRVARFVGPLLAGVCVCATLTVATSGLAVAQPLCEQAEHSGFGVGQPTADDGFGRVEVRRDGASRVLSRWSLGEDGQAGDRFGAAITLADIDGDVCVDVVVGAPGVDGSGAVYVIYGTPAGLGAGPSLRIPYQANPGDAFGSALAVESVEGENGFGRIWIGAPGRDVSGQANAGAVAYTEVLDRVATTPRLYTQNSSGVPGTAEPGDRMGEKLTPLLSGVLVGQPSEDIGARKNAGMVTVLPAPGATPAGSGPYGVTQDTPGIPGAAEAGDRFGAAVDGWWVGAPDEDLGTVRDAGMVHLLRIGATKATSLIHLRQGQDKGRTIGGRPEAGDRFGASVRGGELHWPDAPCSDSQAAIGVPGEDVGTIKDAGEVDFYDGLATTEECPREASTVNMGANARPGDRLGTAIGIETVMDVPDTFLLGAPGHEIATAVDAGVVLVYGYHHRYGCPCGPAGVYTQSDGPVSNAHYGAVLNR